MKNFYDYVLKYGIHDCKVDEISVSNQQIEFKFGSGVYKLNEIGKEVELTNESTMIVEIANLSNLNDRIQINKIRKNSIKSIDFEKFIYLVKKSKLDIYMNFYSFFCNTILIQGYIEKNRYEITISEVKQIFFKFGDTPSF